MLWLTDSCQNKVSLRFQVKSLNFKWTANPILFFSLDCGFKLGCYSGGRSREHMQRQILESHRSHG